MRKWWNDIWQFLLGQSKGEKRKPVRRGLPHNPVLPEQAEPQGMAYEAIRWHGRRQVKQELKQVHRRLFTNKFNSGLVGKIQRLFPGEGPL